MSADLQHQTPRAPAAAPTPRTAAPPAASKSAAAAAAPATDADPTLGSQANTAPGVYPVPAGKLVLPELQAKVLQVIISAIIVASCTAQC